MGARLPSPRRAVCQDADAPLTCRPPTAYLPPTRRLHAGQSRAGAVGRHRVPLPPGACPICTEFRTAFPGSDDAARPPSGCFAVAGEVRRLRSASPSFAQWHSDSAAMPSLAALAFSDHPRHAPLAACRARCPERARVETPALACAQNHRGSADLRRCLADRSPLVATWGGIEPASPDSQSAA